MTPTNAPLICADTVFHRFSTIYEIFQKLYAKIENLLKYNRLQKTFILYYGIHAANVIKVEFLIVKYVETINSHIYYSMFMRHGNICFTFYCFNTLVLYF